MAHATVLVADNTVRAWFVKFNGEFPDLSRNGHGVDIGIDHLKSMNDVGGGEVKGGLTSGRQGNWLGGAGTEDKLLSKDVNVVSIFAGFVDARLFEIRVFHGVAGVLELTALVAHHTDTGTNGTVGNRPDVADDKED